MEEYWDLYTIDGEPLNQKVIRGNEFPLGAYHRIVHIWIVNEDGEYLIQKRAQNLNWYGGRWAATSGSVQSGHQDLMAEAYRELKEELGLSFAEIDLEHEGDLIIGQSLVTVFKGYLPKYMIRTIQHNEEVEDIRWMKKSKILDCIKKDEFVPYSDELYSMVFRIKF